MADSVGDSLDRALEGAFTRPVPRSAQAQMRYLVKQLRAPGRPRGCWGSPSEPWSGM